MKISQDSAKSELEGLCDRNVDANKSDFIYLKGNPSQLQVATLVDRDTIGKLLKQLFLLKLINVSQHSEKSINKFLQSLLLYRVPPLNIKFIPHLLLQLNTCCTGQ